MLETMWEYRFVRFTIYGTSIVLLSEILYHGYRILKDQLVQTKKDEDDEIADVIWTNELTQTCANQHRGDFATQAAKIMQRKINSAEGSGSESTQESNQSEVPDELAMIGKRRVLRLPTPNKNPNTLCKNRFCAANNVGKLIMYVDRAQYTIDLAMYTFTSYELSQAMTRAIRRGVMVRCISDKEMVYSSGSQIKELTKQGCAVRCPVTTMIMHHKFCIIDGPKRSDEVLRKVGKTYKKSIKGVIMSGSLNWTMQGFGGNWENIVITSNKNLVEKFENEFFRMWKAFDPKSEVVTT